MQTHIGIILDKSGSMGSTRSTTIEGFNKWLKDRQWEELEDRTLRQRVTLTQFDTGYATTHKSVPILDLPKLDLRTYSPSGGTALYDAVAACLTALTGKVAPTDRALVLIITDGQENSSRETTKDQIQERISSLTQQGNYTFAYLGANVEVWASEVIGMGNYAATFTPGVAYAQANSWASLSNGNNAYNVRKRKGALQTQTSSFYNPDQDASLDPEEVMSSTAP